MAHSKSVFSGPVLTGLSSFPPKYCWFESHMGCFDFFLYNWTTAETIQCHWHTWFPVNPRCSLVTHRGIYLLWWILVRGLFVSTSNPRERFFLLVVNIHAENVIFHDLQDCPWGLRWMQVNRLPIVDNWSIDAIALQVSFSIKSNPSGSIKIDNVS